jgi:germicidin synthase
MAAYLCPPAVIHGEHAVETSQIVAEVRDRHPHAAWTPRIDGIAAGTGIESRGWMLPLEAAVAPARAVACGLSEVRRPKRLWRVKGSPRRTWIA